MARGRQSRRAEERAARVRQIIAILHKWGIHTLGDFARLDREEIAQRLGAEAVLLWERASGRSTRLLKCVQPRETFAEIFEFEQEIETIEPLLFILRRFLEQISRRLRGIYFVAGELTLRITFSSKQAYERHFKIPQPTNEVDLLFRMLHTHLEDFKSDYPIVAVSLAAEPIKPARQQFGLFETALRDPNQLAETLARLVALLGPDRVGSPVPEETYRPDLFTLEPFTGQLSDTNLAGASASPRPSVKYSRAALRRFRPGAPAQVRRQKKKPVALRSAEVEGDAVAQQGPYHASGTWWDTQAWARREWDVELDNGAVLRCHENPKGWEVDGIYD